MSLAGKLSLITGSTSGIGLGIARSLAKAGSNVVLNGFGDESTIQKTVESIANEFKVRVEYHGADLQNPTEISEMMTTASKFGGIDVLVNNAGIQYVSAIESFPVDRWNAVLNINLNAVFHTTRLALPDMKKKNWGRIINIASVHGLVGSIEKSAYVASKHAVVGLTKVIALENARTGITCNAICPGWVLTPLVEQQIQSRATKAGVTFEEAKVSLLSEKQPSAGFVRPDQLGELAVFLSSESACEVRGVAWAMDGGWTAQ
mmetsp:Transcript_24901/g.35765  ORF Transcript_24901/g.35765 Transcript_24901/m.35765 type:complete len:261 (+) Transcript_24901:7-789(+)